MYSTRPQVVCGRGTLVVDATSTLSCLGNQEGVNTNNTNLARPSGGESYRNQSKASSRRF